MNKISFFTVKIDGEEPFIKKTSGSSYELAKELKKEYPDAMIQHITILDEGTIQFVESIEMMLQFCIAMDEIEKMRVANDMFNNGVLDGLKEQYGQVFYDSLKECIAESEGIRANFKLEIVNDPKGDKQNDEYGIIKHVYVYQWENGGMTGDSFAGEVYAPLPDGRFLKIPYSM